MRSKSTLVFVLLSAIWVAANIVWMGCIYIPLPAKHEPFMSRTKSEIKTANRSKLSRDEVTAKLGTPDAYLPDLHVACYRINSINKRALMLLLIIPLGTESRGLEGYDLAMLEFDPTDHVKAYVFVRQTNGQSFEQAAYAWLKPETQPKSQGKH